MVAHSFNAHKVHFLPRYSGYISVAPSGRYFQDEQGQGFIVIGQNDAITWPGLQELLECSDPRATEEYIIDLVAHGITVSRVMLEYAQFPHGYLENPVGVFSWAAVRFWDKFIELAEKHGLYLLLTPYDTFWQKANWTAYPYSAEQNGPVSTPRDWLTSRAAMDAQKARWEFVIKRWGGSPAIFAWDVMNEIDIWWGATTREISAYITEMAGYVRQLEMQYWGRTHLLCTSIASPTPTGSLGEVAYNHPDLDFYNTHLYIGAGTRSPKDAIAVAPAIISGMEHAQNMIRTPHPFLDTETGPIDKWITDREMDCTYHRHLSWAHLMAGGAGSGMRWPYTNPHWMLPEWRDNLLALARFAATIDWTHFASHTITQQISVSHPNVIKTGCADSHTAILWLLRDTRNRSKRSLSDLTVTIEHTLLDGTYSIELWDTLNGEKFAELCAASHNDILAFTLPNIPYNDVAIAIHRIDL
jgi:hypothetical protein